MKENVLILFGGVSAEHEVSVITGLQVIENIDREKYNPIPLYITTSGEFKYCPTVRGRQDFKYSKGISQGFGKKCFLANKAGVPYLVLDSTLLQKKIKIDIAYTAFHGGSGENGEIQGLLYMLNLPFTSSFWEGAAIAQNKVLTKEVCISNNIPSVQGIGLCSNEILLDYKNEAEKVERANLEYPLIIKPAHLGSSIGIVTAEDRVSLEKGLLEAANIDTEVLVERFVNDFTELNCSVRMVNNKVESSLVEKPISQDKILSFADKYQRGSKSKSSGMAGLDREIPAKISKELSEDIKRMSEKIYKLFRCKGVVRIDFMYTKEKDLYLTEINTIPGSMAFYIWEASGISFREQITQSLKQAQQDYKDRKKKELEYSTDIIEKFVNS